VCVSIDAGGSDPGAEDDRDLVLKRVKLAAEWETSPLWISYERGGELDTYNCPLDQIGDYVNISPSLLRELDSWDAEFQATYRADDPQESGFASDQHTARWVEQGRALALELAKQVPESVSVVFHALGSAEKIR
jgi:hypothetical protein